MSNADGQVVTLGALVGRLDRLEVRCRRCDRHGRRSLARLLQEHAPGMGLPDLAVILAADCPKATATNPADRCFVYFPQLVELAGLPAPAGHALDGRRGREVDDHEG
jgi:hypothetical protein